MIGIRDNTDSLYDPDSGVVEDWTENDPTEIEAVKENGMTVRQYCQQSNIYSEEKIVQKAERIIEAIESEDCLDDEIPNVATRILDKCRVAKEMNKTFSKFC